MTVWQAAQELKLRRLTGEQPDRELTGGYAGDLLSWVMGRAKGGDMWITSMTNENIVAVSSLADVACVVLAEGVEPDEKTVKKADEQGVALYSTQLGTYETAAALSRLL